jgi:hypothetical protein
MDKMFENRSWTHIDIGTSVGIPSHQCQAIEFLPPCERDRAPGA